MLPEAALVRQNTVTYRNLNAGSTGDIVKANPAGLYSLVLCNLSADTDVFVKIYNKATAPTSSDTPVKTILVHFDSTVTLDLSEPWTFSAGLSIRATTGAADNNTGAPASNSCIVNFDYK